MDKSELDATGKSRCSHQDSDPLAEQNGMAPPMEDSRPDLDVCAACGTTLPADELGLCSNPKCRCTRKGSKLAAKWGPVNTRRRRQLLEDFIRDYQPSMRIDERRCKQLSDVTERLEVVKAGTTDHVRLVQTQQTLVAALEASKERERAANAAHISVTEVRRIILRPGWPEPSGPYGLGRAEELGLPAEGESPGGPASAGPTAVPAVPTPDSAPPLADPHVNATRTAAPAVAEPDRCQYCQQAPCVGMDHHAYRLLHARESEEVARRNEEATATMLRMLPYGHRRW